MHRIKAVFIATYMMALMASRRFLQGPAQAPMRLSNFVMAMRPATEDGEFYKP